MPPDSLVLKSNIVQGGTNAKPDNVMCGYLPLEGVSELCHVMKLQQATNTDFIFESSLVVPT